jgi:hypothetical protein
MRKSVAELKTEIRILNEKIQSHAMEVTCTRTVLTNEQFYTRSREQLVRKIESTQREYENKLAVFNAELQSLDLSREQGPLLIAESQAKIATCKCRIEQVLKQIKMVELLELQEQLAELESNV